MGDSRTNEEIDRDVWAFRQKLGLTAPRPIDPMTVINKLKVLDPTFGYLRVRASEMPDTEAEWDSSKGIVRIREDVFRAMNEGRSRALFVFAHELGHYFYKHDGLRRRAVVREAYERASWKIQQQEAVADRFAARFLAPVQLIPDDFSVEQLVQDFGLSQASAAIRKSEVDKSRRVSGGVRRALPSNVVDFLKEAQSRGVKLKTELPE